MNLAEWAERVGIARNRGQYAMAAATREHDEAV